MGRTSATACYRELGVELRKRRVAAGLSATQLAHLTDWSIAKISRIEAGRCDISDLDVIFYLGFCGIYGPATREVVALCRDAQRTLGYWLSAHEQWREDLFKSLIFHETSADASTTYEPQLVPGLLQTADYARVRIGAEHWRSPEDVERLVRVRLERQRILHVPRPAPFTFFVHEQALLLQVGNVAIMHEQMLKLVLLDALEHITVRVVPWAAGERSAFGGPFRLFDYAEHRPLVYLDNHTTGLFLEDPEYIEPYRTLVDAIAEVALDGGQSRELIAALANMYDRGSERDEGHRLEEEQLERRRDERLR